MLGHLLGVEAVSSAHSGHLRFPETPNVAALLLPVWISTRSNLFAFLKLGVLRASLPPRGPGQRLGGNAICLWCYGFQFLIVKPPCDDFALGTGSAGSRGASAKRDIYGNLWA